MLSQQANYIKLLNR